MLEVTKDIRVSAAKDVVTNLKRCLSNVERGHQSRLILKLKLKATHYSFGIEKKSVCRKQDDEIELISEIFDSKKRGRNGLFRCVKGHIFKDGVLDCECKVHSCTRVRKRGRRARARQWADGLASSSTGASL